MTESSLTVADGIVVSLHYTLTLGDNEVVDSSEEVGPLQFLQGYEEILPGLEQELYGMKVGDEKDITISPIDAYGERDEDAFELVPNHVFPAEVELEPGMELDLYDEETGQEFVAWVYDITPEGVVLDFNHPLAGETLYFHVKVVDLRPATEEELSHGHTHSNNNHHH